MATRTLPLPFVRTCLLLAALTATLPARADPAKLQAAEHFDRGLAHVDRGEFSLAIEDFERAYALGKHFAALYNLGLAYAAVGRYTDAFRALTSYLEEGAGEIEEERRRSTARLAAEYQSKIARLEITTSPAGAEVRLDGELRADPSPVEVNPGRHVVTARARGYAEANTVLELQAGERRALELTLTPVTKPPSSDPEPPRPPVKPPAASEAEPDRLLSYVLGGAAVAAGATAIGVRLHNDARFERWKETEATLPPPGSALTPEEETLRSEQDELRQSIETWDTVALVTGAAAGATFAAATILWFTAGDGSAPHVGLRVRSLGAELAGTF